VFGVYRLFQIGGFAHTCTCVNVYILCMDWTWAISKAWNYYRINPMYMATSTLSLSYDTSLNLSPIGARNPAASRSERREQRENLGTRASPSSGMLK